MAILTLAEVKRALKIERTDTDVDLQDVIDAAAGSVNFLCGPSEATACAETLNASGGVVQLPVRPVLSLTTVTGHRYGAQTVANLWVSKAGIVRARYGSFLYDDWYDFAWSAGRAAVPKQIKQGAQIIVKHQWETRNGLTSLGASEVTSVPGLAYAIPNRALQVMDEFLLGPSVGA